MRSWKNAGCLILVIIMLLPIFASADVLGTDERYKVALTQLNAYLSLNQEINLDTVVQEFTDLSGYKEANGFLCYAEIMRQLNDTKANESLIQGYLAIINQNEKLQEVLAKKEFQEQYPYIRETEELTNYVYARIAEQHWNKDGNIESLEDAKNYYQSCSNFCDAVKRFQQLLQLSIAITPPPAPTPPPTPVQTSTPTPIPEEIKTYDYFNSEKVYFNNEINKKVYTGPDTGYVRGANGKAQFIGYEFKCGGRVGDWLFVRNKVNGGGIRYGWINVGEQQSKIQKIPELQFSKVRAITTRDTGIWDSLMDSNMGFVRKLSQGAEVTYLCNFNIEGKVLAFVEAYISDSYEWICGFVNLSDIKRIN